MGNQLLDGSFLHTFCLVAFVPCCGFGVCAHNVQGVPKKTHFQNATGATVHWLNHILLAPLVSGN